VRAGAAALLAACALLALLVPGSADAYAGGAGGYVARPVCGAPQALSAACAALRLLPASAAGEAGVPVGAFGEGEAQEAEGAEGAEGEGGEGEAGAEGAGEWQGLEASAGSAADGSPASGFLTPEDLHAAYSLPDETAASGKQTIAVVDAYDDPTAEADLAVYDEQFHLPPCTAANGCFRKLNEEGKAGPLPPAQGEWAGEISLDVQIAHAVCENCRILLVEAESEALSDLGAAVNAAVKAGATEVSNSYTSPEEASIASYYTELNASFYEHPGVVLTASSGDCGYMNGACANEPRGEDFPAGSPDVVAVGGTQLSEQGTSWTSSVWEETGSGCSASFAAPAWQLSVAGFAATGCGAERSVADVAADASPSSGVDVYDSTAERQEAPTGWAVFSGTSVATPIVAAEFALAGGARGIAFPASTLYSHAGEAGAFYDVVSGRDGSCGSSSSCQAAAGFDGPSGLGSPVGLNAFAVAEAPRITGLSPSSGITGSSVAIEGAGLQGVTEVVFGALPAKFKLVSASRIEATVPNGAKKAAVTVTAPGGSATGKQKFTPTLSIESYGPQGAQPGKTVKIKGVGFNSLSSVSFDGTRAQIVSVAAKKLKVTVPAGAGAGPIAVTNAAAPIGTVYSAGSFTP